MSSANTAGKTTANKFLEALTVGDNFVGAHVNMTSTFYRTAIKDPRVSSMEVSLNGSLTAMEVVSCGQGLKCQKGATWGLASLNTYGNASLPSDGQKNFTYLTRHNGKGVNVYVLDSGVNPSQAEYDTRLRIGPNFTPDKVVDDLNGHGTAMAAIIGSNTYGVAKMAQLTSVKAFDQWGNSMHSFAVAALQWIWDDMKKGSYAYNNCLINLSAVYEPGNTFDDAFLSYYAKVNPNSPDYWIERNIIVAAAGNTGTESCNYSPNRLQYTVGVTAHDSSKTIPTWANTVNSCASYAAPGHRIISFGKDYKPISGYGTSQASAFAAGVWASLLSDPQLANDTWNYYPTPDLWLQANTIADLKEAATGENSYITRIVLPPQEDLYNNPGNALPLPGSDLATQCNGKPFNSC